jgi:hypothetical protein
MRLRKLRESAHEVIVIGEISLRQTDFLVDVLLEACS